MPRAATQPAAGADDDEGDGQPTRRIVPAATSPVGKPAGAMNSAFDVPKPARKTGPRVSFDPAAVKIHRGLPPPEPARGPGASIYAGIWQQLAVDDCAELPDRQAHGLVAFCKANKHPHLMRRLSPTTKGVWKLAAPTA